MGGAFSCVKASQSEDKSVKGNRPNNYTEISDGVLTPEKSTESINVRFKACDEDLYENTSSMIEASDVESQGIVDKPQTEPASNEKPPPIPLANEKKHGVTAPTNEKEPDLKIASGDVAAGKTSKSNSTPAFCLPNSSEIGNYQNIQPIGLKKPPPLPKKVRKEEKREEECVYSKVQKPKHKTSDVNTQQLNYVEVEFLPPSVKEEKVLNNNKKQISQTAYTDVIHKDGKTVLVTSS